MNPSRIPRPARSAIASSKRNAGRKILDNRARGGRGGSRRNCDDVLLPPHSRPFKSPLRRRPYVVPTHRDMRRGGKRRMAEEQMQFPQGMRVNELSSRQRRRGEEESSPRVERFHRECFRDSDTPTRVPLARVSEYARRCTAHIVIGRVRSSSSSSCSFALAHAGIRKAAEEMSQGKPHA